MQPILPENCTKGIYHCGVEAIVRTMIRYEVSLLKVELAHERELREQGIISKAEALALQAEETKRRLEILNHSHEQISALVSTFVSKETYAISDRDDRTWKSNVSSQLSEMRGAANRQMLIFVVVVAILGLAFKFLPL